MIIHPAVVQLVLEMSIAYPDASISEIAKAVEAATKEPFEDLDSPIEALIAAGFPALDELMNEG